MSDHSNRIYHPLTHAQKRVWFTEQIYPGQVLHNIIGAIMIHGQVNLDILEQAIHLFISRHEGLRLKMRVFSDGFGQYVDEYHPERLDVVDFSQHANPQAAFEEWMQAQAEIPFVLEDQFLFRFALLTWGGEKNAYLLKFHHLIVDGWSIQIMSEDIRLLYHHLVEGSNESLAQPPSYIEYVELESNYLNSDRYEKNRSFWLNTFEQLPEGSLIRSSENTKAAKKSYNLEPQLMLKLRALLRAKGWSINSFFAAMMAAYQYKVTQIDDLVLGNPVLNRSGQLERRIFGMFTSTMPLRISFDGIDTVSELIDRVGKQVKNSLFHQKYPYNLLVKELGDTRKPIDGLFQICVNYYNTKLPNTWSGAKVESIEFHSGSQLYSLQLVIKEWDDDECIKLDYDYKISDYTVNDIEGMHQRLCYFVEQLHINPDIGLSDLQLLDEIEIQKWVFACNETSVSYPKHASIVQLFEQQVDRTPDQLAVILGDKQLTYEQLNKKANRMARHLRGLGLKKQEFVAIDAKHSIEVIVAILAILKAGGAYIPVDPEYPEDRIQFIIEDSAAGLLLTDSPERSRSGYQGTVIDITDDASYDVDGSNLGSYTKADDLVYMIYTSGSTGRPKGVMVEQQGLVNYIDWAGKTYVQDEYDAFALYSSLAFDLTVTSIFTPLLHGNSIIIFTDNGTDNIFDRILRDQKVTVVKLTPSHLSLIQDLDSEVFLSTKLRTFVVGGEDLKALITREVHQLFPKGVNIYNEYGPTETVVGCMVYLFNPNVDISGSVPIGVPIQNMQIHILDTHLHPLPPGICGELHIAGDGMARGYMNRDDLTSERFIENPYEIGTRMYKSGDLARRREDGTLEYLGRSDHQVKIRGYRIELGEIENQLLAEEEIKEVVVIDRDNEQGNKSLFAYIMVNEIDSPLPSFEQDIRSKLMKRLPAYMVPSRIIVMEKLPLTRNGKVDKAALPILMESVLMTSTDLPVDRKEILLLKAITEILKNTDIGMDSNFYHLGGDSITAIQIASKFKKEGYLIQVKDILNYPIMKEMAATMVEGEKLIQVNQGVYKGNIELTPIMSWMFSLQLPEPNYYHQSILLTMKRSIPLGVISKTLDLLIRHHDALRINYNQLKGEVHYNNQHLNVPFQLGYADLTQDSKHATSQISEYGEQFKSSLNMETDLLFAAHVFDLGEDAGMKLLLSAHHLVIDAVSWRILLEDLDQCLLAGETGDTIVLPPKTTSYQDWASALSEYANDPAVKEEASYWEALDVHNSTHQIPTMSEQRHISTEVTTITCALRLNESLSAHVLEHANRSYGTDNQDLLLTALGLAICEWTNELEPVIELEGHGREEFSSQLDVGRTIGWFTSIYPVKLRIDNPNMSLATLIKSVKERIRNIPHKGFNYGVLKHLTDLWPESSERSSINPAFRLNYIGNLAVGMDFTTFEIDHQTDLGPNSSPNNPICCEAELNVMLIGGFTEIHASFSSNTFSERSSMEFLSQVEKQLARIVAHCVEKEEVEFTPSDFDSANLNQEDLDLLFG